MFKDIYKRLVLIMLLLAAGLQAGAFSLSLDSIAAMGKVPKFCIDVYHWGDGFFNGYDTTYVVGAGYKFNLRAESTSWIDYYNFYLPDNVQMRMHTTPSTSVGGKLSYMAVSAGYYKNIDNLLGIQSESQKEEVSLGFNCSLFAFNMYIHNVYGGAKMNRFAADNHSYKVNMRFNGVDIKRIGMEMYYFFNHKRYSQAAAFGFSRIQTKSQGSWLAGLSYSNNNYDFDFTELAGYIKDKLPSSWNGRYSANSKNISLMGGYGYNCVLMPNLLLSGQFIPTLGYNIGSFDDPNVLNRYNLTFSADMRASLVWNHGRWFAAAVGEYNTALVQDHESMFRNSNINLLMLLGYRFNLW